MFLTWLKKFFSKRKRPMPAFKVYNDNFDFKATTPETDSNYAAECCIFLSMNVMHESWVSDGELTEQVTPILESPKHGLLIWDRGQQYWEPAQESLQKAYSDFMAEKAVFSEEPETEKKKKNAKPV
jgi:hypothetical protein